VRRRCHLVWRDGAKVGVRYEIEELDAARHHRTR
jgi:hypothetical protein